MAKTTKGAIVVKKKKWVLIKAPKSFNDQIIGETHIGEHNEAVGGLATVSLMVLTGDPQKQSVSIVFKITGVEGDKLTTDVIGYQFVTSALKRMMRKGKSKIEDSFKVVTADGYQLLVKPIIVLRGRVTSCALREMRKTVRTVFAKELQKISFETFFRDLIARKFQRGVIDAVKKIYPPALCEIKYMRIIGTCAKPAVVVEEVKPEAPKEEVKEAAQETVREEVQEETQK